MSVDTISHPQLSADPIYVQSDPYNQPIPTEGPSTEPDGPRTYSYPKVFTAAQPPSSLSAMSSSFPVAPPGRLHSPKPMYQGPTAAELYNQAQSQSVSRPSSPSPDSSSSQGGPGANHYPSSSGVPRLPPILQVEKQQVTTSATQMASASRRRNEAHFVCPVPGCGSTFTRRFNLRGESAVSDGHQRVSENPNRTSPITHRGASVCL